MRAAGLRGLLPQAAGRPRAAEVLTAMPAGAAAREGVRSMTTPSHANHTITSKPKPMPTSVCVATDLQDTEGTVNYLFPVVPAGAIGVEM